jgi:hypothetical protein
MESSRIDASMQKKVCLSDKDNVSVSVMVQFIIEEEFVGLVDYAIIYSSIL